MGLMPDGDVSIIYHVLLALLVPLGWVLILYPYWRLHRAQWYKTLIFVAILSFSVMVAKEIYLDAEISSDDIAADLLGLFFGTGFVSLLLYLERAIALRHKKAGNSDTVPVEIKTSTRSQAAPGVSPSDISLRDIMGILARIHERGSRLFEEAASNTTRGAGADLCNRLAAEKRMHARTITSLLDQWSHKTPDVNVLDWMDGRIDRYGIYASPLGLDASDREIIEYATEQERAIHALFSGLHDYFRGYSWRTVQYENIILELKGHINRFERLHPNGAKSETDEGPARGKEPVKQKVVVPERDTPSADSAAVLVVDDEEAIRMAVAEYLMEDGFDIVDVARDGQEALDYFEKKTYDVVIVDIAMPKQHGLEVLKRIKAASPQTEVIIMTGRGGKTSAISALRLGALDYIEKPFDFAELSKSVSKGIMKKRLGERGGG